MPDTIETVTAGAVMIIFTMSYC